VGWGPDRKKYRDVDNMNFEVTVKSFDLKPGEAAAVNLGREKVKA
jgi:hypothetical protein